MSLRIYKLDASTDRMFGGIPAAVCPLTDWLPEQTMQLIACENNLAETAFYMPTESGYHIRWFSPTAELELCEHATLAAAYVVFFLENSVEGEVVTFDSRSGNLHVSRQDDWLTLDLPIDTYQMAILPPALEAGLSTKPAEVYRSKADYLLVYGNKQQVLDLTPDFHELATLPARGVIVTAPDTDGEVDFISRFFGPPSGIKESPTTITGSAHTTLIPYWAKQLGKTELTAYPVSKRAGYLRCRVEGDRVYISGQVRLYLTGEINI